MTKLPPLPKMPTLPPRPAGDPLADAMYDLADALRYPVDSRGRVYDVTFLAPIIAYHLARCGAVVDRDRAIIKARPIPLGPGVMEGAVEWVGVGEPDRVVDELAGVTVDDFDNLSPSVRAELIRRLGGDPAPGLDQVTDDTAATAGWRVQTSIQFDDEESTR